MIVTDSTTASSDTEMHDKLMAAAEAADRGEAESPLEQLPSATQGNDDAGTETGDRATESNAQEQTDNPESSADTKPETQPQDKSETPRDEQGKFKKADEKPDEAKAEDKPEAKPESNYSKAQKDEARLNKSWQQLEQEKAEVRKREQELGRLQQDVNQLKRRLAGDVSAQARFDSKQYQQAAVEFEKQAAAWMKDGETDKAQEQLTLAQKCRVAAGQAAQAEYGEAQQQFEATWRQSAETCIKEHPELGDPKTEEAQAMMALLEKEPILAHIPDGFRKGVEILQGHRATAEVSGLRDENAKLKTEVARLNAKLSPLSGKSGAGHSTTDTGFNSWPVERQREHLQRQAEVADAS